MQRCKGYQLTQLVHYLWVYQGRLGKTLAAMNQTMPYGIRFADAGLPEHTAECFHRVTVQRTGIMIFRQNIPVAVIHCKVSLFLADPVNVSPSRLLLTIGTHSIQ